jgi:uncharacterized repeat protein (TIGR02543 family)
MRNFVNLLLIISLSAAGLSCSLLGGGDDEPEEYQVTLSVNPENTGTVNFTSRTFTEGDTVSALATPQNGYSFNGWTGSRTSSANPFEFVITSNTDLTANFQASSSKFSVDFSVSDEVDELLLEFGLDDDATDGFDNNLDFESPPPPPQDALHAYFNNGSLDLLKDFRNSEVSMAAWPLGFQPSTSDSVTFSWTVSSIVLNGSLTFSIPDISEELDMTEVTQIKIHRDETSNMSIDYALGGN